MLRYFIERSDLQQVNYICKQLNEVKSRLYLNDFDNPQKELELCNVSFEEIFTIAENENNEKLANSNYVFKCYFLLFCHLMSYFSLLQERSYKSSWSSLQDCIDDIQYIGKFAEDRLEVVGIIIAALHGYGGDALFRGEQQILGFRDTQLSDVLHGRTARAFLENM